MRSLFSLLVVFRIITGAKLQKKSRFTEYSTGFFHLARSIQKKNAFLFVYRSHNLIFVVVKLHKP